MHYLSLARHKWFAIVAAFCLLVAVLGFNAPAAHATPASTKMFELPSQSQIPSQSWFTTAYNDGYRIALVPLDLRQTTYHNGIPDCYGWAGATQEMQYAQAAGLQLAGEVMHPNCISAALTQAGSYASSFQFTTLNQAFDGHVTQSEVGQLTTAGQVPVITGDHNTWATFSNGNITGAKLIEYEPTATFDPTNFTADYTTPAANAFGAWSATIGASTYRYGVEQEENTTQLNAGVPVNIFSLDPPATSSYPNHTNIVSTTFWVGEIFNAGVSDGSQVCSTYDTQWALHWDGLNKGTTPSTATACPGSVYGSCDGVGTGTGTSFQCATEARTSANGYEPSWGTPLENAFYLDLPYDDVNDPTAFANRCTDIPWAAAQNAADGVNHCADSSYSYMKNRWVQITGPNGNTCYGQIEDAGPSSGSLYHDANYVFGSTDARPANTLFSGDPTQGAGMDVSPALNGCLGFASLNGDNDHVSWKWIDAANVPTGPWTTRITTSGVG